MKHAIAILLIILLAGVAGADPAANDTCADALYLIDQGFTSFDVDLCQFNNDYDLGSDSGCSSVPSPGPDAVWRATIRAGDEVQMFAYANDDVSPVIYIVTDCDDPAGSCVAASVDSEGTQVLDFVIDRTDIYYFIVDSTTGCGSVHVDMGGVLPAAAASWSSVKSLYR